MRALDDAKIVVVGLGYVGLPLAVAFGRKYDVVGYDINVTRVEELRRGVDLTLETSAEELAGAARLRFTTELEDCREGNVYIVTVPTPVDPQKRPDLSPLRSASVAVGKVLQRGDVVIYESTVYPGATEEVCVPILEATSGLTYNRDFTAGYSPERINPGDKLHRLETIIKITSGSTPETAQFVDELYNSILEAGTHRASSIAVAEAAKVIENTQRDVNIALVNELAMIFNRMGVDTLEVLEAAGTKWNFLPFRPGLVGGHCIGVDPYYLTFKAEEVGYHPEMILAERRVNDGMGIYVSQEVIKLMLQRRLHVNGSRMLVLGLSFKENCPDLRNTRVVDILRELQNYGAQLDVYDPWVKAEEARREYGIELCGEPQAGDYDAVIIAVGHRQFREWGADRIRSLCREGGVVYDIKYVLPKSAVDGRL